MTARECESGKQAEPLHEAAPGVEAKPEACGICGNALGGGPKLVYMPEIDGQLREVRVCPFCFLKIVMEVKG